MKLAPNLSRRTRLQHIRDQLGPRRFSDFVLRLAEPLKHKDAEQLADSVPNDLATTQWCLRMSRAIAGQKRGRSKSTHAAVHLRSKQYDELNRRLIEARPNDSIRNLWIEFDLKEQLNLGLNSFRRYATNLRDCTRDAAVNDVVTTTMDRAPDDRTPTELAHHALVKALDNPNLTTLELTQIARSLHNLELSQARADRMAKKVNDTVRDEPTDQLPKRFDEIVDQIYGTNFSSKKNRSADEHACPEATKSSSSTSPQTGKSSTSTK